jgi:glycine reductase
VEELPEPGTTSSDRPRVAVVTNLQTQGKFKDVFVYGRSLSGGLPTVITPGELDDGAVVSGQFGHPALKNPTYLHQTHPVVAALHARDELELAALVLCPEPVDQASKELISAHAARLCAGLGLDAAIVTKEGGGNADADATLKLDRLEEEGITAVGILGEMAGRDGTGPPLVVPPTRATAMVSTGNYDERMTLPAVERALGRDRVALLDLPSTDELELPVAVIYCAQSTLGWGRLTCAEVT